MRVLCGVADADADADSNTNADANANANADSNTNADADSNTRIVAFDTAVRTGLKTSTDLGFEDLCVKGATGACVPPGGHMRFWGGSAAAYHADVTSDAALLDAYRLDAYPDGGLVPKPGYARTVGSPTFDGSGPFRNITGGEAVEIFFTMVADDESAEDVGELAALILDLAMGDNAEFKDVYNAVRDLKMTPQVFLHTSVDDGLSAAVGGDSGLFVITYFIMTIFTMYSMSRLLGTNGTCADKNTRVGLGGQAIVLIFFSIAGGYGVVAYLGTPMTSLTMVLPFILVGIGIDDGFIIVSAFDQVSAEPAHASKPLEERIGLAMRVCGMSITLTSITDFVAFELGALSTSPGVRYFCHYAAAAILMDYVLQITAFVACLCWDSKRVERRHPDCSCCISPLLAKSEVVVPEDGAKPDSDSGGDEGEGGGHGGGVMTALADFILKSPAHKALVLMAVLGLDLFLGLGNCFWSTPTLVVTLALTLALNLTRTWALMLTLKTTLNITLKNSLTSTLPCP